MSVDWDYVVSMRYEAKALRIRSVSPVNTHKIMKRE